MLWPPETVRLKPDTKGLRYLLRDGRLSSTLHEPYAQHSCERPSALYRPFNTAPRDDTVGSHTARAGINSFSREGDECRTLGARPRFPPAKRSDTPGQGRYCLVCMNQPPREFAHHRFASRLLPPG